MLHCYLSEFGDTQRAIQSDVRLVSDFAIIWPNVLASFLEVYPGCGSKTRAWTMSFRDFQRLVCRQYSASCRKCMKHITYTKTAQHQMASHFRLMIHQKSSTQTPQRTMTLPIVMIQVIPELIVEASSFPVSRRLESVEMLNGGV